MKASMWCREWVAGPSGASAECSGDSRAFRLEPPLAVDRPVVEASLYQAAGEVIVALWALIRGLGQNRSPVGRGVRKIVRNGESSGQEVGVVRPGAIV